MNRRKCRCNEIISYALENLLLVHWRIFFAGIYNDFSILAFESTGFRSQLRESCMSSHTDEFWENETDLSVDANMYIYIYIYINDDR